MGIILNLDTIAKISCQLKEQHKKVVFTHGAFDLFHIGHADFLTESKKQGDILIVGVESDERIKSYKHSSRPVIPLEQRASVLASHKDVDFVLKIDGSLEINDEYYFSIYDRLQPYLIAYGISHHARKEDVKKNGIIYRSIVNSFEELYSTTAIIQKISSSAANNN